MKKFVPHENIREYEAGFDSPYDDDCVPVKHKGYNLEVVTGKEKLEAKAKAYTEKISIVYGKEKETQKALGLTAGWNTASIDAGFAQGAKSTWGWKLVEHSKNESGDSMNSTFSVTVQDIISAQEGSEQGPACVLCDHCGEFVHKKEDHKLGTCPLDPSVKGCGVERWSCETSKEKAWHQKRTCEGYMSILLGIKTYYCKVKFRHCQNSPCDKRILPEREKGHYDGSISEAPAGVANPYADSHNFTPPPSYHACGVHLDWQSGDHSMQASCSETDSQGQYCTVTNFYACQSHTHQYPALISGACGHSYTASSSYSHRLETCPKNSRGDSCTSGSYYACQSHTHVYPPPPTVTAPVWSDIPDPYNLTVGDSFYLDVSSYVSGSPTLSRNGGVIPAGLRNRNGVISGTVTRVESRSFRFTATNAAGSANSEWIKITVTAAQ